MRRIGLALLCRLVQCQCRGVARPSHRVSLLVAFVGVTRPSHRVSQLVAFGVARRLHRVSQLVALNDVARPSHRNFVPVGLAKPSHHGYFLCLWQGSHLGSCNMSPLALVSYVAGRHVVQTPQTTSRATSRDKSSRCHDIF